MKKIVYIILVALMILPTVVSAQGKNPTGRVKITPKELSRQGDNLCVDIDMNLENVSINRHFTLCVTPVLSDGTHSKELPSVLIQGKRKYKEYQRQVALRNRWEQATYVAPYKVEKGYDNDGTVNYRLNIPFEQWMAGAQLDARSTLMGCGSESHLVSIEQITGGVAPKTQTETIVRKEFVEPYQVTVCPAYLAANAEAIKNRAVSEEAHLDFAVGKTDIRVDFGNNPSELQKIRSMVESVQDDKGVTVRGIDITGYASPEGSLELNARLSEGRANALKGYLQSRYDIPRNNYSIHFGGEDWDGLVAIIKDNDMEYKQTVLSIIDNVSVEEGREKQIMELSGGMPYKYMLREYFPSLRKVVCKVDYRVANFDLEQAKEVIKTRPQNLSLNEMYTVANSYPTGSQEFNDVFETAVRMFPDDQTANLNAAVSALSRGDVVSAERYIGKVKARVRIPEYDNAMGMLELLKGNYDKAESYLKSAAQTGLDAATKNLEELQKKRANALEIEKANAQ